MENEYCETCKYWLADKNNADDMGWCNRYAPRPVWLPKPTYDEQGHWWTPKTFAFSFCGEWCPK